MPDSLDIFGVSYPSALGIKAYDTNGNLLTFIKPTGTIAITSNGSVDVSTYATASVSIPGGPAINNQNKSVTPSESQQSITYDNGYTGLGTVTVEAVPSSYVGTGIARKSSSDLSASGSTVTVPSGYYGSQATANVAAGAVAVPTATISAAPILSINNSGLITANVAASSNVAPTVTAGYVSTGAAGAMNVSGSSTIQLTTQAAATITPSETQQTAVVSQRYTTGNVVVAAISSDYVGSNIPRRTSSNVTIDVEHDNYAYVPAGYYDQDYSCTIPMAQISNNISASVSADGTIITQVTLSSGGVMNTGTYPLASTNKLAVKSSADLTASGSAVTAPAGYYSAAATKTVSAGTAGTPTAAKGAVSNHQISITPSVTNTTGWITGSTKTGTAATVSASELVSGTSTISANGTYDVTNYASAAVSIDYVTYYTGRDAPSSALGSDGDIYLQL